jgi:hypothetical protein
MSPKNQKRDVLDAIFEPFEPFDVDGGLRPTTPREASPRIDPDLDLALEEQLAMSPAAVRASLASRGHDVRALEAEARAFLGIAKPKRSKAGFLAMIGAPSVILTAIVQALTAGAPAIPILAKAPSDTPAVTAAAPPPTSPVRGRDETKDGGAR